MVVAAGADEVELTTEVDAADVTPEVAETIPVPVEDGKLDADD